MNEAIDRKLELLRRFTPSISDFGSNLPARTAELKIQDTLSISAHNEDAHLAIYQI